MQRNLKSTLLLAIGLTAATAALAYDGAEKDFATCTGDQGNAKAVVAACTRLIDNAATENALVGLFYAMRATANDDKASNCRDAQKVLELADSAAVKDGAAQLIDINC